MTYGFLINRIDGFINEVVLAINTDPHNYECESDYWEMKDILHNVDHEFNGGLFRYSIDHTVDIVDSYGAVIRFNPQLCDVGGVLNDQNIDHFIRDRLFRGCLCNIVRIVV